MGRTIALAVALLGLLESPGGRAQTLIAPDEMVISVHTDLKDGDFVEGLVCELGRVLVAPVRSEKSDLPLYRTYLATKTQLDPRKIVGPFRNAVSGQDGRIFRFLLLPHDLKVAELNYVFSETYMAPQFAAVMSTIRLMPRTPGLGRKRVSDVTGDRLYKLMLKAVARMAGLRGDGCVLAFPRNLDEFDRKSAEFCPEDRAALVAAGVLKDKPYGACDTVAMVTP
jgi:predicted Zn-dependent protease